MTDEKKRMIIQAAVSVLLGWAAVFFSQYPIIVDRIYNITVNWAVFFPVLAAMAWGRLSAAAVCTIGGIWLVPFFMTPELGCANVLPACFYVLLILMTGFLFSGRGGLKINIYGGMLVYSLVGFVMFDTFVPNLLLYNSAEYKRFTSIIKLRTFSLGFFLSLFLIVLLVRIILCVPTIRKALGISPMAYSQKNAYILMTTVLFGAGFFVIDRLADGMYFTDRGIHTSIFFSNNGSSLKALLVLLMAAVVCDYIIFASMKTQRSNEALENSEERYRTVFNSMIDAYIEVDREGKVLVATPSVSDIFEHNSGFVTGKAFSAFFADPIEAGVYINRLFDAKAIDNIEMKGKYAGRQLLLSGKAIYRAETAGDVGVITIRDITDYKKNDDKRKQLSAMTNAIFESNRDLIWVMNGYDFSLISFNRAFTEYVAETRGITAQEGTALSALFSEREAELIEGYCYKVLQQGKFFVDFEADCGRQFELSFYPVRVSSRIVHISVFAKDMTQQFEAERTIIQLNEGLEKMVEERTVELKEAYSNLESYTYSVTHEFKTPIREIDAYMSVLEEDNADILSEFSKKDIGSVRKICSETLDMIQKMMIYSKAGYMVLNIESVNMTALVKECFDEAAMGREFPCVLECGELPPIDADAFLMRVAIANIMSNSVKFSQKKGRAEIFVGYMRSPETITYYFTDKGSGFRRTEGNDLFGLYNRAHNSSDFDGSGIGLALVKKVCQRTGGEVYIFGKENVGCTVVMEFVRKYT